MEMQMNQTETQDMGMATSEPAGKPAEQKPTHRAVSDPREVATIVMARMNQVNAKKDELAMAINGLVDITQQLTRTYAEQLLAIEQLRRRVKALETAAASTTAQPPSTVQ
jgi:hypothetical protein